MTFDWFTEQARTRGYRLSDAEVAICRHILVNDLDAALTLERGYRAGTIPPAVAAALTPELWRNKQDRHEPHYPTWREMFRLSGFTTNCEPDRRPRRAALLFRGATVERRGGLSWSYDPNQAHYFATQRQVSPARACVWMARVPADLMLARYLDGWEQEVVVDACGLTPVPLDSEALDRAARSYRRFRPLGCRQVAFTRHLHRSLARSCRPHTDLPPLTTPQATTDRPDI